MRKLFTKIIYSSFVLLNYNLLGQIPKSPVNIQAPNSASFNTLADFKVSTFVGSPAVDIPLCNLSDGSLNINLGLNYNATGVRPDVHSGWVGLNMNLAIGGAIVRTVKDVADDYSFTAPFGANSLGFFYSRGAINDNNWSTNTGIRTIANFETGALDTEADEFSFNMMGLSGKFYLGSDGNWKVQSEQAIKVEIIGTGSNTSPPFTPPTFTGNPYVTTGYIRHVAGFILTDESGTRYEFGGGNNNYMEYGMDFFNQGKDSWICNAWNLKSVTTHTGQVINFTYERGDFIAQMYLGIYNKAYSVNGSAFLTPSCSGWSSLYQARGPYGGKLISPLYLKEITSKNVKVEFLSSESTELRYDENIFSPYVNDYLSKGGSKLDILTYFYDCYYPVFTGTGQCDFTKTLSNLLTKLKWRKLDKIRVTNTYDNIISKEFDFTYNNVATQRLMLQKVQEKANTTSDVVNPHEFTYNTDAILTMPNYLKSHTDHWGFNNGLSISYPSHYNIFSTYGSNYRSPATDEKYYLLGTLNKVKYPTGGFTEFTFEPHTYSKEVKLLRSLGVDDYGITRGAGGLRIKNIRSYDPATPTSVVEKSFYYVNGFNPANPSNINTLVSSGVLGVLTH